MNAGSGATMNTLLQFGFSGLTMGAVYALVAIGFVLIYNACEVVNFAQGEFVMLGGLLTVLLNALGIGLAGAAVLAVALTTVAGLLLYGLAIRPAGNATTVTVVIITIGASICVRGIASVVFGKDVHGLPAFVRGDGVQVGGASLQPQGLLVLASTAVIVTALWLFLSRTLLGKAIRASSANRLGARLSGIGTTQITALCFALSGAIGAIGGLLITPVALMAYDAGAPLALKGFAAAVLGGMGNPLGAVLGGLLLGLLEAFGAGLVSSLYKDAIAFVVLLVVLVFRPSGLLGHSATERV